jgi:hypothetical protein
VRVVCHHKYHAYFPERVERDHILTLATIFTHIFALFAFIKYLINAGRCIRDMVFIYLIAKRLLRSFFFIYYQLINAPTARAQAFLVDI